MALISTEDAICCLLTAGANVLSAQTPTALPAVQHSYLTDFMTYPYCSHDAIVAREIEGTLDNPSLNAFPVADRSKDIVWFDRFEIAIVRAGVPSVDIGQQPVCVDGLYGDCTSTDANTLSGHYNRIMADRTAFRNDLITAWCECMFSTHGRSKSAPAWIESYERRSEGRFGGTLFTVAALLA